jgi:four helix bundle protein
MATFRTFEDIEGWKLGRELTREVYRVSSAAPFSKDFALLNQIRRASVSIMSNIAEGFDRDGNKEFINFLTIAKGSAAEVRAQLYVAVDQNYISNDEFETLSELTNSIGRVLAGLIKYLQSSDIKGPKFKGLATNQKPETRN